MKKFIVFDLDGTLIDSLKGITYSVNKTLKEFNYDFSYDEKTIMTFIGGGAPRLITMVLKGNFDEEFYEHYVKNYENDQYISEPYPHVVETLKELDKRGYALIIYSNKPDTILKKLIEKKLNDINFLFVQGHDRSFPPKPDVTFLNSLLAKHGLKPENGYYVGDSIFDLQTARNAKLKAINVTYGYAIDINEVIQAKPDYLIDDFKELLEILWHKTKNLFSD